VLCVTFLDIVLFNVKRHIGIKVTPVCARYHITGIPQRDGRNMIVNGLVFRCYFKICVCMMSDISILSDTLQKSITGSSRVLYFWRILRWTFQTRVGKFFGTKLVRNITPKMCVCDPQWTCVFIRTRHRTLFFWQVKFACKSKCSVSGKTSIFLLVLEMFDTMIQLSLLENKHLYYKDTHFFVIFFLRNEK